MAEDFRIVYGDRVSKLLVVHEQYAMVQQAGLVPEITDLAGWQKLPLGSADDWKRQRDVAMFGEPAISKPPKR